MQLLIKFFNKKIKKWKHYLPIVNLALLIAVISLLIISVLLIYYPQKQLTKSGKDVIDIQIKNKPLLPVVIDAKPIDYYKTTITNNPFSPTRVAWTPTEAKIKQKQLKNKVEHTEQIKPNKTPKKINLRGVIIIGDVKKALIENPDPTSSNKPFVYVEEGEEIVEYKVKSIEKEQIKLDWYGEEHVIEIRSKAKQ